MSESYQYEVGQTVMSVVERPLYDGLSFVCDYGALGVVENIDEGFDPPHVTVRWDATKRAYDMLDEEIIPINDEES